MRKGLLEAGVFVADSGEPMTDADRQQQLQYEEWLTQHGQWLAVQVKFLEQQVGKHRKAKKSLAAKQRQVRTPGLYCDTYNFPCTELSYCCPHKHLELLASVIS